MSLSNRDFTSVTAAPAISTRRSRRVRRSKGKRLMLTGRDLAVFRTLARYRYLSSTYLHAFAGGASETRFKERLGDLFHESFLDRPTRQWELADFCFAPVIYELGKEAARCLEEYGAEAAAPVTFLDSGAHRQFHHALLVCEFLASIELAASRSAAHRFISWPEILARAPAGTRALPKPFQLPLSRGSLIPDGLFGLEYLSEGRRAYRFFALEVDRGTMPIARSAKAQSSYIAKLTEYQEVLSARIHARQWGISTLLVATITTNQARVATMIENAPGSRERSQFLFKAFTHKDLVAPARDILGQEWLRSAHPPFCLDR